MTRLPVCCVLGLLLAMTSPGLTAPTTMPSLDGVLSGIPGLPSFVSNMDAGQLVAKVAELHSRGRLAHYLGVAEMFLGLPRGQGSELERVNAIVDAVVPQPEQAALLKAEVTSVLNNGGAGMQSNSFVPSTLSGNPSSNNGASFPSDPLAAPSNTLTPVGGLAGNGLTGGTLTASGLTGSGLSGRGLIGSGLTGSGFTGSGLSGVGLTGSGLSGSSLTGSGLIGSGLSGSTLTGSGLTGSGLTGSAIPAIGLGSTDSSLPGQTGSGGVAPFPMPFSSQWRPGAGLQWIMDRLGSTGGNSGSPLDAILGALLGGGLGQGGLGGQTGGAGQGPQGGQTPQGGDPLLLLKVLGAVVKLASSLGGEGGMLGGLLGSR